MSVDGLDVQISGVIYDASTENFTTKEVSKFMKWMLDSKSTTLFTEGRFGLRLNDFPHLNVVPTSTYGYVLSDIRFIRDGEHLDKVQFVATLRLSGDIETALGVTTT